jgi:hypothetical protein
MNSRIGMGMETRWGAVTKAIGDFVGRPEANGLGVGISYFGPSRDPSCDNIAATCTKDSDCAGTCGPCVPFVAGSPYKICQGVLGPDGCDLKYYAAPETPIAPLPGNAQAILDSLGRHQPQGGTPTSAALQGAVNFCKQWATDHPGRVVVNVLATDGLPEDCDTDPANIQRIAATAFGGTPSIRTFIIGVGAALNAGGDAGAAAKQLLDGIAQSGGSMRAFMVSDADATRQFLAALQTIRGSSLQCAYAIPDAMGRMPDLTKVNVRHTPGGGMSVLIPKVANAADCAMRDGWYYDNENMPTSILMCPATCDKFSMGTGGTVEIEVGCATIIAPPR